MKNRICLLISVFLLSTSNVALSDDGNLGHKGLNQQARHELMQSGVIKYLGQFAPVASQDVGDGWTKHTYAATLDVFFGDEAAEEFAENVRKHLQL